MTTYVVKTEYKNADNCQFGCLWTQGPSVLLFSTSEKQPASQLKQNALASQ